MIEAGAEDFPGMACRLSECSLSVIAPWLPTTELHDLCLQTSIAVCLNMPIFNQPMPPSHSDLALAIAQAWSRSTYALYHFTTCTVPLCQCTAMHVRIRLLPLHQLRAPEGRACRALFARHCRRFEGTRFVVAVFCFELFFAKSV